MFICKDCAKKNNWDWLWTMWIALLVLMGVGLVMVFAYDYGADWNHAVVVRIEQQPGYYSDERILVNPITPWGPMWRTEKNAWHPPKILVIFRTVNAKGEIFEVRGHFADSRKFEEGKTYNILREKTVGLPKRIR